MKKEQKKTKCKPDNSQGIFNWQQKRALVSKILNWNFFIFFSYRFLPERALAAINHVQDIQFEAVIGHKTKMKWINVLQAETYAP